MCGVRNSVPGGINIVSVRVVQFSLKIAIEHVVRVVAGEIKREIRVVVHRTNLNITGFTYNNTVPTRKYTAIPFDNDFR